MKDKKKQNKVFDILDKMELFQGQRAGRELWNDKPKEVQDKDISDFIKDINYIRSYLQDSVVLSSEEFEKLKYTWITDSDAYKKGCKETAEKILNAQYQECKIAEQDVLKARGGNKNDNYYKGFSLGMTNTKMDIQELARQFGVEIKEL